MIGNLFKKISGASAPGWRMTMSESGIAIRSTGEGAVLHSPLLQGYIAQLIDDGLASEVTDGVAVSWDDFYSALASPGYSELPQLLCLPEFAQMAPRLRSSGSLTDDDFSIVIDSWIPQSGRAQSAALRGALIVQGREQALMRPPHWALVSEVLRFAHRTAEEHSDHFHRASWGKIRNLANRAGAHLDDFLDRTVVLTPERLNIELRKSEPVAGSTVVEVSPQFEGAPPNWLERFDARKDVPDRYDVLTERGIVQILVTPQVKTVLQEIKRMPGRRVAGSRAEAFVLNPYATLGPDAKDVIDEEQFAESRESAGLLYERFTPHIRRDATGYPLEVGLLIETAGSTGPASSAVEWLTDESLGMFIVDLESAISGNHPLLGWNGYDLEIQGESPTYLDELKRAFEQRKSPPPKISWEQVYDLSSYSERIEGIGEEKPYYSPYIAKKDEGSGWFPENVEPFIVLDANDGSDPVSIPASDAFLERLEKLAKKAEANGQSSIDIQGLPRPMGVDEAHQIVNTFKHVKHEVERGKFNPTKDPTTEKRATTQHPRTTLILRSNIQKLDYEVRRQALQDIAPEPQLPKSLRPDVHLLPHQLEGLAWLQHLYRARTNHQVGGCVLADDMGLGKTFQLLAFMAWRVEHDPLAPPLLVVAPVSLLENWKEEVGKFIQPGTLPILTAYGAALSALRVPRHEIDERLRNEDRLVNFLKAGWVGGAKLVLTTYETLRDLEFSFAAEHWSVMVCDEAQKIKNPAAMVTRAAKKQKVDFKIACTGTPVENTLADLWCLFDFIQPGLLGALDEFGRRYRKPIEARNDEDRVRVEELRERIAPQILRRTKAEVAKDLPNKIEDTACRQLKLSNVQRILYAKAVEDFKKRDVPGAIVPFKNHLGLLHYLRLICTDPRPHGLTASANEPLKEYKSKAPKLDWLLEQLERIRDKGEKAIVFCEFRDIQRLLQHYVEVGFKYKADIINGDTTAAAEANDNRQRRIKAFQDRPGFGVIILSPVAVGFGVNIQAANHVIHYTRTWNPAKEDQATDRAYRIGQTKDVYVYYPVVRADDFVTFDVKLDQLLSQKRELATDMLNGSGDIDKEFDISDVVPDGTKEGINPRISIDTTDAMSGRYFEGLAAALWGKQGHNWVFCTPQTGDQGVDVVAIRGIEGVLIQTKQSSSDGVRLGWDVVKELQGGEAYYRKRFPQVAFSKIGLTNQFFNTNTHEHARLNGVRLIERAELQNLLDQHLITLTDVERQLLGSSNLNTDSVATSTG
ncbi:SNF2-related protein [Dyella jiangningensis]|uniref:SNF2-related protein n=1 Tax=Dyella jiangningensis TaxID=1379159 RepID=UPI00240F7DCB|nr:SNF2-related protein [Dyella jiangningensis]MDG2539835.1 SNF2-related protein [Dyella jiangningensis]